MWDIQVCLCESHAVAFSSSDPLPASGTLTAGEATGANTDQNTAVDHCRAPRLCQSRARHSGPGCARHGIVR